jgi:uncharacterized membrane protein YfcA
VTHLVLISFVAFLAGAINSIAGGGTLLSFPALVWIGVDPVLANATNTIALWPGSLAGAVGFRRDLAQVRRWMFYLTLPALAGGGLGAVILLHTSSKTFSRIVPFLILGATLLLAAQEFIARRMSLLADENRSPSKRAVAMAFAFQFLVGIYGGYFGAGIGILMLAALGLIGMRDMHQMNGLKNLLAICINGVAAIYFMLSGAVLWHFALSMAVASIAGGYGGARVARRMGRKFVRSAVVSIGLVMAVALFIQQFA